MVMTMSILSCELRPIPNKEQQRQDNIERNRELLEQFNVLKAKDAIHHALPLTVPTPAPTRIKIKTKSSVNKQVNKTRRQSSRLRGVEPLPYQIEQDDTLDSSIQTDVSMHSLAEDDIWDGKLLKADEYFNKVICEKAIRTQGRFLGWVNPELIEKYQFEMSASEAWEKNGGGKYSLTDPLGVKKKGSTVRVNAKAVAQMMFKKNPNMYFYRHNEPGVSQWTGDWTLEEKEMFLKVAREHGCGDKWGIFASYIPHRVGYQCSNFYRSELLPAGLIFDKSYEYTPSGRPIYIGSRRSNA
ncbi:hypothetical protein BDF14DRAFT_1970732 [Spinellus fusiger]|nr:hypothetical protein BDF14DRAFT_1970732 [Spinellus fusiger]